MNIVLVSNVCSDKEYCYIQNIKHKQKLNASQKYFDMLVHGLVATPDVKVTCLTARFIASSTCNVKYLDEKTERVSDRLFYHYVKIPNLPIIRNLSNIWQGYMHTRKLLKLFSEEDECALICDPLAYDISFGAICATRGKSVKTCAVITDLPFFMHQIVKEVNTDSIKNKFKTKFMNWLIDQFDCYGFLTESMNIINPQKKPYAIIEGMMYYDANPVNSNHVDNNIVVYAGGLYEQFGILNLVEAAKQVKIPGFELHLYGEGTCTDTIKRIQEEYPHIKYMGTRTLKEIVDIEKQAKLLVNPRPSDEEFTKYSFPSKTIEYMSVARPVLTTRLKGIPEEYFSYVYTIEDESVEGIKKAIENCLEQGELTLDQHGAQGYDFLLRNKTDIAQARKLIEVIMSV